MRALVLLAGLAAGCRAAPAWEPIGGFELVPAPDTWHDVEPRELADWLAEARARLASMRDYAAVLETRERIEDDVHPRRVLAVRVRERPFSACIETREPENERGQRVWYDESKRRELLAETPGLLGKLVGRVWLDPAGDVAMENRRHPITDTGLARLLAQVEEVLGPALERRPPPRVRASRAPVEGTDLRLADALVPSEHPDPPLVYRLGFAADSGLLVYFGLAELLPDGVALVEEYWYHDLAFGLGLADADFRPAD